MSDPAGKYARFEYERRFLATELPPGIDENEGWRITDRYIESTRLRLRRQEPLAGGPTVYKLGQKESPSPPDFSRTTITTIYLSQEEYDVFAPLPASEVRKRRHRVEEGGRVLSVDVFEGALNGLILAEVTFESVDEMTRQWHLPSWVTREVSDDVRFTGGLLAELANGQVAELIRS